MSFAKIYHQPVNNAPSPPDVKLLGESYIEKRLGEMLTIRNKLHTAPLIPRSNPVAVFGRRLPQRKTYHDAVPKNCQKSIRWSSFPSPSGKPNISLLPNLQYPGGIFFNEDFNAEPLAVQKIWDPHHNRFCPPIKILQHLTLSRRIHEILLLRENPSPRGNS